jgi:Na+-driven multidrug efflux pump
MISANVFQALGRGTPSLVISILRNLGILLPMMYLLGQAAGIDAVWYAFPITEMITCAMSIAWLARISKAVVSEADQLGTARTA